MSTVSDGTNLHAEGFTGSANAGQNCQFSQEPATTLSAHYTKSSWWKGVQRAFCILLAPALYLILYIVHFTGPPTPTGFLIEDMAYYSANGRAVFERGNGLAGPNPYDPDPAAPAIYFHWLTWILGFGSSVLGLDPGLFYCGVGLVASILLSWFTLRLVERLLPDSRFRYTLFFLVMWGGGALCLGRIGVNLTSNRNPLDDLFAYDPFFGLWILYWGRNVIYPVEAVYHVIMAATWLAVVCNRRPLVLLGAALLATTHPWSGLQLLLMLGAWFGGLTVLRGGRSNLFMTLSLAGMLSLFLAYYFVFLASFEQHRAIQHVWTLTWVLPMSSLLLAHGPIGLLAACRAVLERFRLPDSAWFFATVFLVSLLLAKHEWFITPRQPLHFTRGYVWVPLCLIALPLIQRALVWCHDRAPTFLYWPVFFVAGSLVISDNLAFVHGWWKLGSLGYTLTPNERQMFAEIGRRRLDGVLLTPDPNLSLLTATYTRVRPYYGHIYVTPDFAKRIEQVKGWKKEGKIGSWFDGIDYILLPKSRPSSPPDAEEWEVIIENAEYNLFARKNCHGREKALR